MPLWQSKSNALRGAGLASPREVHHDVVFRIRELRAHREGALAVASRIQRRPLGGRVGKEVVGRCFAKLFEECSI